MRAQAIEHNLEVIRIGERLGSKALTLWIGDGANFPGQQHLARAFERYVDSAARIYAALPPDWRLLLEHKMYEPALYTTVIQDWGSSLHGGPGTRTKGLLPGGSWPSRARRQHREDRGAADSCRQARRVSTSTIRNTATTISMPGHRPLSPVSDLQRAGRCGAGARWPRLPLHARSVAQRHRPDREPDGERHRAARAYAQAMLVDRVALGRLRRRTMRWWRRRL